MGLLRSIQPSGQSDADLLELYRRDGDQDVLARLFLRYHDLVYGTCVKYLGDPDKAKDAVIDLFEALIGKAREHRIEHFKSWLYVVTKNHCLQQLRQNKKMPLTEFDADLMQREDFSHLENVFEKERQLNKLTGCLDKLSKEQQDTVRLFYLESKCYQEITVITGFDWNKVRSLVQNGRRNLKNCMEANG